MGQCGRLLIPWRYGKGKFHSKTASDALFTFYGNFPLHPVYQILHNGHAKAGAFDFTGSGILHSFKGHKNFLQEFPAHAHSIVFTLEMQPNSAVCLWVLLGLAGRLFCNGIRCGFLSKPHMDFTIRLCIFYSVSYDIHKNLPQTKRVAQKTLLMYQPDFYLKILILLGGLRTNDH